MYLLMPLLITVRMEFRATVTLFLIISFVLVEKGAAEDGDQSVEKGAAEDGDQVALSTPYQFSVGLSSKYSSAMSPTVTAAPTHVIAPAKHLWNSTNEPRSVDPDLQRNLTDSPCRDRTWAYSNKTGYCYNFASVIGNWQASVEHCRDLSDNVTLLEIEDEVEQDFIDERLFAYTYEDHWLGAKDHPYREEHHFELQSRDDFPHHPRWAPGEPSVFGGCVYIARIDVLDRRWYWKTADCDGEKKMIYCREKARRCPDVPSAPHLIPSSRKPNIEPVITFRCAPGYYMPNYTEHYREWKVSGQSRNETEPMVKTNPTLSISCNYSAQWDNTSIAVAPCAASFCDPVPSITHASHNASELGPRTLRYPSYLRYTCKHGYYFARLDNRSLDTHCAPNKKWISNYLGLYPTRCDPVRCEALKPPRNTTVYNRRNPYFNQVVGYRCARGLMFPDRTVWKFAVCRQNFVNELIGRWNDTEIPDCQELRCPIPPRPVHTVHVGDNQTFLATITYHCDPDYEFPDSSTEMVTTCTEEACWTPRVPECTAIPPKIKVVGRRYKPEPVDAPAGSSIGSTAAIILIILAGLIVFLDANTLRRDFRRMRHNLRQFRRSFTHPTPPMNRA